MICTIAGTGLAGSAGDGGAAVDAELFLPQDVRAGAGVLYVVDWNNHTVREVRDGIIDTVIGVPGRLGDAPEGPARESAIHHPSHVAFDPRGDLIVSAWHNYMVLRFDVEAATIAQLAGTGEPGFNGDDLPALETHIDRPVATAVLADGSLAIADQQNQRIRRLGQDGLISTLAGTGDPGYSGDGGPADEAEIHLPAAGDTVPAGRIDVDAQGAIYLADTINHAIRRIDPDGTIATVAARADRPGGSSEDAVEVDFDRPSDVIVAGDGSLYVADTLSSCVRRISPEGAVDMVAGRCGERGYEGDGGPATEALLNRPYGIDLADDGVLYIADTHNHVIRAVYP